MNWENTEEQREYHPVSELFPLLDGEAFDKLVSDIAENGLVEAIDIDNDGRIIDGRNRHRACLEAGVEPRFEQFLGKSELKYVVSKNLHRRHLNSSQRAAISLDALEMLEEEARERQATSSGGTKPQLKEGIPEAEKGQARDHAAEMFQTNPRYVQDAKKLKQEAPDLLEDVKRRKKSIPAAKQELEERKEKETKSTVHKFNRTNENIEWASWSWNPVTGCKTGCEYCYARDIANRFYDVGFEPTFRPERLEAPQNTKVPKSAEENIGDRNVFVCSMGDLFGSWVPDHWINAVLSSVQASPQWTFLFLTKYPRRLLEIDWPENSWVGTTVDVQERVASAQEVFNVLQAPVKFVSCEPLREPLEFEHAFAFDWMIIGGQSKSSTTPEFNPPFDWVWSLTNQARQNGCQVYWKPNLWDSRPKEYPK